jgi:hypothetical protein
VKHVCENLHQLAGIRCIRSRSHDGRHWSKWSPVEGQSCIQRAEWTEHDGETLHYGYITQPKREGSGRVEG